MATKYCDHGIYSPTASFTAAVNANGNTLTVTGCTGTITRGATVSGLDPVKFPYPVIISAFGTGTGGNGTYTLNYSSFGAAITGATCASIGGGPATVPTWGSAQDGDGTAKTAGTPSTAEIVFTGIPSSGSIFILGVVVTATWATSANNCANLLATAINALTTTAVGPASFTTKSQVRNHVYARGPANGAPAGTCQIMTRQASASHAGLVAFTHTLNNVSSAATVNFSGGTGGCYGWLVNPGLIWPSSVTQLSYGLFTATPSYTGSLAGGDVVKVRSAKTIALYTWNNGGSHIIALPAVGTKNAPVLFEIDDSTEWADGSDPVLELRMSVNLAQTTTWFAGATSFVWVKSKKYSDTNYGLLLSHVGNQTATTNLTRNTVARVSGVKLTAVSAPSMKLNIVRSETILLPLLGLTLENSLFQQYKQQATEWFPTQGAGCCDCTIFRNVIFDCGPNTNGTQDPIAKSLSDTYGHIRVYFDNCRFINFVIGSRMHNTVTTTNTRYGSFVFRNCDFGNVSLLGPNMGGATPNTGSMAGVPDHRTLFWGFAASGQNAGQTAFIDTPMGWSAWIPTLSFPTLNARLQDNTPWSLQVIPTTVSTNISKLMPFEAQRISKINSLSTAVRTLTVELGIEQSLAWTKADVSLLIEYEDASGVMQTVDTFDFAGSALTDSTSVWSTDASSSQFTWSSGGTLYFNKKKFSVTTPTAIKTGSRIGIIPRIHTYVADTSKMVFIDPEITVV